ncbi:hypothetical protein [Ochrobactrum soli]|uniref:Uncharacterized protein n=1 Tax=Ochrobactrum soli TaxID=2448455 RepID=A0A2P9HET5_9HYPH|nr:hypothetical protein [[Ochrobactrum] soli]SPL62606.1 hypothetical protein OHAE_5213 [[Ochrobactrum] soli]
MGSWSKRLVAGWKNWRSRTNNSVADETPAFENDSPKQTGHELRANLSIKVTTTRSDQVAVLQERRKELENPPEAVVTAADTTTPARPSRQAEPVNSAETEKSLAAPSAPQPARQQNPTGTSNADTGQVRNKQLAGNATEELLSVRKAGPEEAINDHRQRTDLGSKGPSTDKPRLKNRDKAEVTPPIQFESESSIQPPLTGEEPQNIAEPSLIEAAAQENAAVSALSANRHRGRRSKTTDEAVTDQMLAELEAENARLKLLLRERLKAEQHRPEI